MRLPFQIYDFVATLFPGILLLIILRVELHWLSIWEVEPSYYDVFNPFVCHQNERVSS